MTTEAQKDYAQRMKEELTKIIETLDIDERQKVYLSSRWLEQIQWADAAAKKNQRRYYLLRLACIIGGVTIPALVSYNFAGALDHIAKIATVILSLIVAVSAAIEEFFHFGERWRHYRHLVELLKGEGWSFFQLCGHYNKYDTHKAAISDFVNRVEEALQKEVNHFITQLSHEKVGSKRAPQG